MKGALQRHDIIAFYLQGQEKARRNLTWKIESNFKSSPSDDVNKIPLLVNWAQILFMRANLSLPNLTSLEIPNTTYLKLSPGL